MKNPIKLTVLRGELSKLRERHVEDLHDATFMGWTPQGLKEFDERERKIVELARQVVLLEAGYTSRDG